MRFSLILLLGFCALTAGVAQAQESSDTEQVSEEESISARELRSIEQQVHQLKEQVFEAKARLQLLEEKVIKGLISGARLELEHSETLSAAFVIEAVEYSLDGEVIFEKLGAKGEARDKERLVYEGNIPPGQHVLTITMTLRGDGAGLFSYVDDYQFRVSSSFSFSSEEGKTSRVDVRLYEKGGMATAFTERPAVEFEHEALRTGLDEAREAQAPE